ncbi:Excinuclease ABC, B subunit [Elusimicrobium minutum Pei191]|uniref:UvrABC system protein B n=1 Tax=Elusimicrobium minutum (strain Pei191) TaxID=445932 RepID=B2KEY5_ELUMP|nr:excinuclease ABC subunit UvrB [Elusimicrobium minutum]ACC99081.1 Excinuclease ABC, B subunit [Elusimicrobium minutum Pei191]
MGIFKLKAPFSPSGDQPQAIKNLCQNIKNGQTRQTLLGVTGSGKTYTMANIIAQTDMPALIMSPNKVLAAQLYAEFKQFFPENSVEYFISYYDYYQPEAYIPQTDTYIEKDSSINEHIEQMRLKATTSLLTRNDVIVIASVSSIYNIGSPDNFAEMCLYVKKGIPLNRVAVTSLLIKNQYERSEMEFTPGKFRLRGGNIDILPPYRETGIRIEMGPQAVNALYKIHPITGDVIEEVDEEFIYPAKHFVVKESDIDRAIKEINEEKEGRVKELEAIGKPLEAYRLKQRTEYDMEMLKQTGFCKGIENYSRPLAGREPGSRPDCLFDYFRKHENFLVFIDESHVAVPQVRGMYNGDRSRKQMLIDFGFRLPSALDNRPLKFDEFEKILPSTVFVSATPGPYELTVSANNIVEQVIRPTGLVDPQVSIHPTAGQIGHLISKIEERIKKGQRSLVLSLTKKTAEDLTVFFDEKGIKARYLHSDIESLERVEILQKFKQGVFDVLVGINLLREGLDIPQVGLVAILGADNEGFLRNETTLIQISGRAARNIDGEVVLYADRKTDSIKNALAEMDRRREKQTAYNKEHHITPQSIIKAEIEFKDFENTAKTEGLRALHNFTDIPKPDNLPKMIKEIERQMKDAADNLNFELAVDLRDRMLELKSMRVKTKK